MTEHFLRILLVEDNPGDALLVAEMLSEAETDAFRVERADSLLAALDLLAERDFDVILLDLNLPDSNGMDTFSAMRSHAPETPVVLLTGNDDDALAIAAVEAGAQDYLVKDGLDEEVLAKALRYAVVRQPRSAEVPGSQAGKLIGVLGSKGGVGATTLACHLATALEQTGAPVLLVDLDLDGGDVGFLMQAKTPYTAMDAADNVHRLDERFWRSLVAKSKHGVDVLVSPSLRGQTELPAVGRFRHLLRFARKLYRCVVVDLGRLGQTASVIAPDVDELLLVTTTDLMAVQGTGRVLECLSALEVSPEVIRLVHNQAGRWPSGGKILEAVVNTAPVAALPSCESELVSACTEGRLLGPGSGFGREVARLARAVAGIGTGAAPPQGFLSRKWSWFGGRETLAPSSR